MRRSPVALALVAVALTAAACGGSSKSSDSSTTSTDASASGSSEAAGVLSSIDRTVGTSPQKIKLDMNLDIKGTPSNAQLAVFTKKPIQITLDGVVASGANTGGDMKLNVSLG